MRRGNTILMFKKANRGTKEVRPEPSTKDTDERIRHALILLDHVKNNNGDFDEKRLYQELKAGRKVR